MFGSWHEHEFRASLLEREVELEHLSAALARAAAGEGSVTMLEGVAGIGKTSLLVALRDRARAAGMLVLSARGAELELEFSFGVARQLFAPVLRASSEAERSVLLAGAAGLAGPLLGLSGESVSPSGSDASFALLSGLYWLTVDLTDRGPMLVVVDDLQWADGPSLRWLSFLRARIDELPIAVVTAFRPEVRRREIAQFSGSDRDLAVVVLRPAPLTSRSSAVLTRGALGAQAAGVFCDACHAATGGNPFLLRQLFAGLRSDGIDPSAQSAAEVGGYRSDTLGRWILARLARLGDDALALATAVCILGVEVPLRRAGALARLDQERATLAADRLADAEILQRDRPLTFVHAILAAAVEDQLALGQRGLLHKQAAQILANDGASAEEIAAHLLATEPAGEQFVVEQLSAAAEQAQARGAPDSAAAYLLRALAEPPEQDGRPLLLHQLGLAGFLAHDPSALDHLTAAHSCARDRRTRAAIALDLAKYLIVIDQLESVLALLQDAIDDLGDLDDELAAQLEVWLIFTARIDIAHSRVFHQRIARLRTQPLEDSATGRQQMCLLIDASIVVDQDYATAAALAERAFADGKLLDELGPEAPVFYHAATALVNANCLELATAWCDRAITEARKRGSRIGFALAACCRALANLNRGALADAEADARAGLASGGVGSGLEALTTLTLTSVLLERGELDETEKLVLPVAARCEGVGYFTALPALRARGRLRIAQGDVRGGLEDLIACGDWLAQLGINTRGYLPWASDAALAHHTLGEHDQARELAQRELTITRQVGEPRALGIALRTSGVIEGNTDQLREALEVLERSQAPIEYARALIDLGAALRRAARRSEARDPLAKGLDLADRCGATLLATRAREELLAAGARPRRHRISGIDSLTASERRIAQMAAQGHTSRQIAQALFVTTRTVDTHLNHTYTKLGINSRKQLPHALAREA